MPSAILFTAIQPGRHRVRHQRPGGGAGEKVVLHDLDDPVIESPAEDEHLFRELGEPDHDASRASHGIVEGAQDVRARGQPRGP